MLYTFLPVIALFSSQALAHGTVKSIVANGKTYQGYSSDFKYQKNPPAVVGWTADVEQQQPIMGDKVDQPDVICHKDATNAQLSAEVAAGTKVKLNWTPWPESHKGPVMDYLADCGGDCSTVDKTTLKFFKIDGVGMTGLSGVSNNSIIDLR
jgi:cellulase